MNLMDHTSVRQASAQYLRHKAAQLIDARCKSSVETRVASRIIWECTMMPQRTTMKSAKFNNSFRLNGVDPALPAGTYLIETDDESIAEIGLMDYHRVRTMITVLTETDNAQGWQVFTIDPHDLEDALARDASATEERRTD